MTKNSVGRPKRSNTLEPVETRVRMLEVAEQLLEERGYGAVSMDAVAKQVGVTKATIYHHFPDGKEALILTVAEQVLGRHRDGITQAIASSSQPRQQLEAIALWMFSRTGGIERMLRQSRFFLSPPVHAQIYAGFRNNVYLPIETVIKAGIESGEFAPHDTAFVTSAFLTLLTGFEGYREHRSPLELARDHTEFVLNGIISKRD